jgi:DNA polymerase-2
MRLWVIDRGGHWRQFIDPWRAAFYVEGRPNLPSYASTTEVERQELFSGQTIRVLEVRVPPRRRDKLVAALIAQGHSLYSADIHPVQAYHYDRGHFPLAGCLFTTDDGTLLNCELRDDPWAIDYELPPLKIMRLRLAPQEVAGRLDPNHAPRGRLVLGWDEREHELEGAMEDQLETLSQRLKKWDPDVILSDWGDTFLLPHLDALAKKAKQDMPWSRDPDKNMVGRAERSFYTYGRTIYQGGAKYLFGRWHLDARNSFLLKETDTTGLFEMARIAKIPVQRAARCTIGTSLASMQMAWAWKHGVLIPIAKQQAEDFRPATDLLIADKGGLCYEPDVGWHEQVAEYDFTSMYPEMMVRHNISPETVNCDCCPDNKVPEIGHHLCTKRRGLVPSVLEPILLKRAKYKTLSKQGGPKAALYKSRAAAHKWTLVCCFGYLGFKNARFGKIESHECVTAWGREILLRAKESVERRGFYMLHALVDSLWIKIAPGTDLEALRLAIEEEAGCPLALEGVYKWLNFCASRQDSLSGIPGRYFGCFSEGELKLRGIASRRHDTPLLFKNMQADLLERLSRSAGLDECKAVVPELLDIVEDYRFRLKEGSVRAEELAITFNLSQEPEHYKHDTVQAIAARQLAAAGVTLHAGETVRYVITASKDKVKDWRTKPLALMDGALEYDVGKYLELMERAALEILEGLIPAAQPTAKKNKDAARNVLELPLL